MRTLSGLLTAALALAAACASHELATPSHAAPSHAAPPNATPPNAAPSSATPPNTVPAADPFAALGLTGVGEEGARRGEGIGLCPECASEGLAKLRIGAIVAIGNLPTEVIQEVVRQHGAGFLRCYKSALRDTPRVQGRVTVAFVIANSGVVVAASVGDSDLPDARMVACVTHEFSGLRFPAPSEGEVHVVFPLQFFPPVDKAGAPTRF